MLSRACCSGIANVDILCQCCHRNTVSLKVYLILWLFFPRSTKWHPSENESRDAGRGDGSQVGLYLRGVEKCKKQEDGGESASGNKPWKSLLWPCRLIKAGPHCLSLLKISFALSYLSKIAISCNLAQRGKNGFTSIAHAIWWCNVIYTEMLR